ncbi:hypothetical protein [Marinomonas posidonica]|uniref:Uncharacterized protein n=1 Tax=Marinomonas posidonica (strain CECT 7376 / NCIMB 14433 / IVIA-Po-181) TaxID=491952 RepID=F6CYZ4_MARPP|nr:hypothetical protein [Marinomonas posidonica]AEF53121.1 hypothetical protein Mar181_0052 [Marinomonas posidonica IVIA-Po-181]
MPKKFRPIIEGLAVGCVFISITMLFQIPLYMSFIIGALAAVGGYRNSIKMDKEKAAKNAPKTSDDE